METSTLRQKLFKEARTSPAADVVARCMAIVNFMDSGPRLRIDIGFYVGKISWALLESLYRLHVLLTYQNIVRCLHGLLLVITCDNL